MDEIGLKNYKDDLERLTHKHHLDESRLKNNTDMWNPNDVSRFVRQKMKLLQKQRDVAAKAKIKREDESNYRLATPVLKDKLKGLVAPNHQVGINISKYLSAGKKRKTKKRKKGRTKRRTKRKKRKTKKRKKRKSKNYV